MTSSHILLFIFGVVILFGPLFLWEPLNAGTLSCTVATTCSSGTVLWRMESTTNGHAELPAQGAYPQLACCTGVTGLSNTCSDTNATVVKLSGSTNAHVEQNTQANYAQNACISVPNGGTVSVGYQPDNCTGYDTTVASMSGVTNAHAGDTNAYTTKICASASGVVQSLTFSISDNSIGFGTLSSSAARYATGDTSGSGSDVANAHTVSASTSAASGYTLLIDGATLTCSSCGGATITPIGASAAASAVGTEQFGMRMVVDSGTGSVTAPYSGATFALDTASFPDQIATGAGDSVTTQYGLRYIGNIATSTDTGNYSAILTFTMTATF